MMHILVGKASYIKEFGADVQNKSGLVLGLSDRNLHKCSQPNNNVQLKIPIIRLQSDLGKELGHSDMSAPMLKCHSIP
jgi:hypothetical protein